MRSGPGTGYQKMKTLPARARVNIQRCAGNWCSIRAQGFSGWISASFVRATHRPARATIVVPPVVIRPPHYRRPYSHRPTRPRPPHGNRLERPKCRIAPGYSCPR
ncbi:SH3 domain-containing protein [Brucella anthropi]|uniref:SH3 domain-containing protein n=1 Tax=Brucella anthropi TaxID=529 RepID=UPI00296E78F7|nr:SH3 domain-containing protein [Ochrobactrum sp. MYb49]